MPIANAFVELASMNRLGKAVGVFLGAHHLYKEYFVFKLYGVGAQAVHETGLKKVSSPCTSLTKRPPLLHGVQSTFTKSLFAGSVYRYAHTDVTVPSFDEYRRESTKNVNVRNEDTEVPRKVFSYATLAAGTAVGLYAAKCAALQFIGFKGPPFIEEAASVTEINLNLVAEGKNGTFLWRGTPVFVRHRTAKEIAREANVNLNELRDPQHDKDRVQRPEWLITLAPCTHLGCVPIAFAGDYGGYFCPCHGSHYDASGRIRRGPAPRNLDIPYYTFKDDHTVIIGKTD